MQYTYISFESFIPSEDPLIISVITSSHKEAEDFGALPASKEELEELENE